jgi:hypothetical protein
MDIIAHVGRIPATEEHPDRWVGVLVEDRGRVAGDATGALGKVRDLDLTEWFSHATTSLSPDDSDLPWGPDGPDNSDSDPVPNGGPEAEGGPMSDEELANQEQLEVGK